MKPQPLRFALIGALVLGVTGSTPAQPRDTANQLELTGRVVELHAPRLFTVREADPRSREILVLSPRPLSPALKGANVRIIGTMRRLTDAEIKQATPSDSVGEQLRVRLAGRVVLVARSVVAALESPSPEIAPPAEPSGLETPEAQRAPAAVPSPPPLTIRASTLVADLDGLAGQPIRIVSARVVGLLAPTAFLIEPATQYLKAMGTRDRIVVLIQEGELRVPAELVVGETVIVEGIARTLLGMQVTREVPWPARLERETIRRLEVRAAFLATSVRTSEGTELIGRASGPGEF